MATLIVKATERCNSRCSYCDVVRKPGAGSSMAPEVLETLFRRVDEYLRAFPEERVELLWHGGEPLLLGPRFFVAAQGLQARLCQATRHRIGHSIQTNLTLFDGSFVEPLRELGITAVGTSYDPEPRVRGGEGPAESERYTWRFLRSLALAERSGFAWGMIYVVTRASLARPLDVFHLLTNLQLSGGVNLNPVLVYGEDREGLAVTPEEFARFLGAIFPAWWAARARFPNVQPFRSLVENVIEGKVSLGCVDSGRCSYRHVNVAPDGSTSQCGRSADWGLLPYGNLADRPLADILRDPQRDALDRRVRLLREGECSACRFWDLCHGGCPLDAWSRHRSFDHKTEWCAAKSLFLSETFEPTTGTRWTGRGS
jgi:radical SAM protein with 4Fe4S-binding SPASM domain